MKNYDLPVVAEDMTLAEIVSVRNRMTIDAKNDLEHPLFCAHHPAHQDWIAYAGALAAREVEVEAETKRLEQDAALDACEEVDPSDDLKDQIAALEQTPGFLDGTLRRTDRPRHDRILTARSALYARASNENQDPDETPETEV